MNNGSPDAFAAQLSWPEVQRRVKVGAVAVRLVGAASGVWGAPTLASEEKRHRLLAAMVDDLFAAVEALQREQFAQE
ncbi:MAG: hypothetical protein U9Q81_10540 [Pseudomonadota bacterium]|nr:hypothetical protein [Pseudomonadota bacterium]